MTQHLVPRSLHYLEQVAQFGSIQAASRELAKADSISLREFVSNPVVFQSAALSIRKLLEARHSWIFERAAYSVVVNFIQLMKLLVVSGRFIAGRPNWTPAPRSDPDSYVSYRFATQTSSGRGSP
jgi:hypothetical protein